MPRPKKGNTGKSDLAHKAYMGMRQMLFYNEITPGQKIKYQDLANRLGVSITPVIHALKWLEFKGIVRHEPNVGYHINEISLQEVKEIYDTRLLLETSLLPETLSHIDEKGIQRVQLTLEDFEKAIKAEDYYGRIMTDMKFHMTLASLSKCRIQLKMLQELFDLLLLKYSRNLFFISIMDTSRQEHWRILEDLKVRNLKEIQKTMTQHIRNVKDHILKGLTHMLANNKKEPISDFYTFQ
jgi:DNA-binding GntR family transcriptional regulator